MTKDDQNKEVNLFRDRKKNEKKRKKHVKRGVSF